MAINAKFAYKAGYKAIYADYTATVDKLEKMRKWQTDKQVVKKEVEDYNNRTAQKLAELKRSTLAELTSKAEQIKNRYKNTKKTYDNPQAELLRRQDFDMELSFLDRQGAENLLFEEGQNLTAYELNAIRGKFGDSAIIRTTVERYKKELETTHETDPTYADNMEQIGVLNLLNGMASYIPTAEGFNFVDLTITPFTPKGEVYDLLKQAQTAREPRALAEQEAKALDINTRAERVKKLEYPELDSRIFRGAEGFDITHRFKYLRERLAVDNDRWDITRADYDPLDLMAWLEDQHAQKMDNDPHYKALYQEAERQATYASNRPTEED